jgi:Mg-chelatase subunit ChlD
VPIVFNEACVQVYTDVALVIDASTTMLQQTPGGRTKLAAAQEAAKAFVDSLRLERDVFNRHDQAAIIWYNDRARVATPLTNDRDALHKAIDLIPAAEGSRIDLGLEFGHRELLLAFSDQRILSNAPVMILLSDGKPNRTSLDRVIAASDAAKADAIAVYTVGHGRLPGTHTGADYWPHVLGRIASQPQMYYHAPNSDALADVYEQIAGQLICR